LPDFSLTEASELAEIGRERGFDPKSKEEFSWNKMDFHLEPSKGLNGSFNGKEMKNCTAERVQRHRLPDFS